MKPRKRPKLDRKQKRGVEPSCEPKNIDLGRKTVPQDESPKLELGPIPEEFRVALNPFPMVGRKEITDSEELHEALMAFEQPFTPAWDKVWVDIASTTYGDTNGPTDICGLDSGLSWADLAKIIGKDDLVNRCIYPGASERYQAFKEKDGPYFLQELASRGAQANFILSLFIKYLWNDDVSNTEHTSYGVKLHKELLEAVQKVKKLYYWNFKRSHQKLQNSKTAEDQESITLWIEQFGGKPSEGAERVLDQMEAKLKNFLEAFDFREQGQRRPPSDKVNRIIFTTHKHLKQRTGGPQWEQFWNLLVAAEGIRGRGALSNKDRQIIPHIESFQKDHLREALFIKMLVTDWPPA